MRKHRREWDEGAHVRHLPTSYRAPVEELMTLTDEQFRASEGSMNCHRTLTAIFTDMGLIAGAQAQ